MKSADIPQQKLGPQSTHEAATPLRQILMMATAGASLLASQYIASRELGSTFFVTELSLIAATVMTLVGPSLGYALSLTFRPSFRIMNAWAMLSLVMLWLLPVGIRTLWASVGTAHPWLSGTVLAIALSIVCGYYSFILPLIAKPASVPHLYAAELCGAALMLLFIAASPSHTVFLLAAFLLASLLCGLAHGRALGLLALALSVVWTAFLGTADRRAAELFYRRVFGQKDPQLVESHYSPYQRIDVIAEGGNKSLFLDGVPFYRAGDLDAFDVFLAKIPGKLLRRPQGRALVIGSGSFSSAAHLFRLGYRVHVIELDAAVAQIGFRQFAAQHQLQEGQITVEIADARTALPEIAERYDLIVLDVPAPYRTQTALLHAPAFYSVVAQHLTEGGIVALSLCASLREPLGRQIAASAALSFSDLMVVESEAVGLAILYAGNKLPFSASELSRELRSHDPEAGEVIPNRAVRRQVLSESPLSQQNLLGVLWLSREAMSAR
ncbi:MAG TPA: hypothetical protein PKO07_20070 [Pseudomonadota bacterium]|nr:hypothetical protein [Pseudomonadota bacterium]HNF96866.1 hypothetical protein [Pseudomonadota bacterium]HNN53339.1 hypothetical protein [Pseudomonadota bacterium]